MKEGQGKEQKENKKRKERGRESKKRDDLTHYTRDMSECAPSEWRGEWEGREGKEGERGDARKKLFSLQGSNL